MRNRQPPWLLLTDVGPIPGTEATEINPPDIDDTTSGAAADSPAPTPAEAAQIRRKPSQKSRDPTIHLSYLRYLQRHQPPRTTIERFGAGYQDYLQAPLQPLTDNLESITYEVFEKDPVKYDQYLLAIQQALCDWRDKGKQASGPNGRIVVAVVGAGRGPLVTRALQASDSTGIPIEMWAVEKNPNAYVLLQRHNEETWDNRVNLVKSDMRSWKGPIRAQPPSGASSASTPQPNPQPHTPIDILISELLGSFADNELSPECLDGVQHVLNPIDGISIPASYTAHLTPIAAPKLHADIAARTPGDPAAPETPWVVMLHAIDYLSTTTPSPSTTTAAPGAPRPQPTPNVLTAWEFTHPLPASTLTLSTLRRTASSLTPSGLTGGDGSNAHNARYSRLSFRCRERGVCHGLAGYFETVLYGDVELSTNPVTMGDKSADMISWFPIFFPLKVCKPSTWE